MNVDNVHNIHFSCLFPLHVLKQPVIEEYRIKVIGENKTKQKQEDKHHYLQQNQHQKQLPEVFERQRQHLHQKPEQKKRCSFSI